MRAFWTALFLFCLLIGALVCYGIVSARFTDTLASALAALPDTPDGDAAQTAALLCALWEKNELLLHLSVPQGRLDAMQEKLTLLFSYARDRDAIHYRAALETARSDAENLCRFETISLENLI